MPLDKSLLKQKKMKKVVKRKAKSGHEKPPEEIPKPQETPEEPPILEGHPEEEEVRTSSIQST